MQTDWITLDRQDGIAHLRLHRPPVNQFDSPLLEEILAAVGTIGEETRALVVSSDIEGCFAAGGDLPWMARAQLPEQLDFVALCQDTYTPSSGSPARRSSRSTATASAAAWSCRSAATSASSPAPPASACRRRTSA